MLTQIHIRNLATIEELQLNINPNSSMITGETGAGKSIFIEAIELALGARGSANLVRTGKERADISLCFDLSRFPNASNWLKQHDFYQDDNDCIIRRAISQDGRSRSYINGLPATQQLVRELGELVFHLHGQYEQQVLFKADNQRDMLDRYGENEALTKSVKQLADKWKKLNHDIQSLRNKSLEGAERCNFLRFQLDELSAIKLEDGEWQKLEAEHHKLSHSEELIHNIERVIKQLNQDDGLTILQSLRDMRKTLEQVKLVDKKATDWLASLDNATIHLDDLSAELNHYLESTDIDPERLQHVEQRITQIFDICRKHKIKPEELATYQERLQNEFDSLESSDDTLSQLLAEQQKVADDYFALANTLSKSRKTAAKKLGETITKTIRSLALPYAEFDISLESNEQTINAHGLEKIHFLIKTNPEQTLQPLAKVVSGGELSRVSLAAHLALAHVTSTPTLIFDEVDTGVGGGTAEKIGKLLRELGEAYQVFCVTHQAQVAIYGHHHLFVEKKVENGTTHTNLRYLSKKERANEVARMLGGEKITQKTLDHAEELLTASL